MTPSQHKRLIVEKERERIRDAIQLRNGGLRTACVYVDSLALKARIAEAHEILDLIRSLPLPRAYARSKKKRAK